MTTTTPPEPDPLQEAARIAAEAHVAATWGPLPTTAEGVLDSLTRIRPALVRADADHKALLKYRRELFIRGQNLPDHAPAPAEDEPPVRPVTLRAMGAACGVTDTLVANTITPRPQRRAKAAARAKAAQA